MGVNPKIGGKPPKWMVEIMVVNPIKMDDLGVPLFLETPMWDDIKLNGLMCWGVRFAVITNTLLKLTGCT